MRASKIGLIVYMLCLVNILIELGLYVIGVIDFAGLEQCAMMAAIIWTIVYIIALVVHLMNEE